MMQFHNSLNVTEFCFAVIQIAHIRNQLCITFVHTFASGQEDEMYRNGGKAMLFTLQVSPLILSRVIYHGFTSELSASSESVFLSSDRETFFATKVKSFSPELDSQIFIWPREERSYNNQKG